MELNKKGTIDNSHILEVTDRIDTKESMINGKVHPSCQVTRIHDSNTGSVIYIIQSENHIKSHVVERR
jgi:hypothetical protein